jgi:DNA polymerase (family X)
LEYAQTSSRFKLRAKAMPVQNAEIAAMFDQAAELLEIKGDNPFRTRAYRRAARVIESLPKSAEGMLRAGDDLTELPGIGEDLAGKIAAIIATGKFDLLESLKRELPGSLSELTAIPGLGPKRVKLLLEKLDVRSVEDFRRAAKNGRLRFAVSAPNSSRISSLRLPSLLPKNASNCWSPRRKQIRSSSC